MEKATQDDLITELNLSYLISSPLYALLRSSRTATGLLWSLTGRAYNTAAAKAAGLIASGTTYMLKMHAQKTPTEWGCAVREEQTAERSPARTTQDGIYSAVTASVQGRAPPPHLRAEAHLNTFGSLAEVELDGRGEGALQNIQIVDAEGSATSYECYDDLS